MRTRPVLFILMVTGLFLSACGIEASTNWPGVSALGDEVYVAYGPEVVAISIPEQKQLWKFPAEASQEQYLAPPSVFEDLVIIGDYGKSQGFFRPGVLSNLYAFSEIDADVNGTPVEVWTSNDISSDRIIAPVLQVEEPIFGTTAGSDYNGAIFFGTADNKILGVDRADGSVQWSIEAEGGIWSQPAFANNIVYVTSMDRTVRALNAETGAVIWAVTLDGAMTADPYLTEDFLLVASYDAKVHALDPMTGDEIWVAEATNWIWGRPAVSDMSVVYGDNSGMLFAVEPKTGAPLWEKDMGKPVVARPVEHEGIVYVATARADRNDETGTITAFSAESGEQQWMIETPAPVFVDPVIVDDALVVLLQIEDDDNLAVLNVYELDTGIQRWTMPLNVSAE